MNRYKSDILLPEITTLSFINSLRKSFGIKVIHPSDNSIDKLLDSQKDKNVVLILLDGLGLYNMELTLKKNGYFFRNTKYALKTCYPATTVAATGMIETGYYPYELGRIGWYQKTSKGDRKVTFHLILDEDPKVREEAKYVSTYEYSLIKEINDFQSETAVATSISPYGLITSESLEESLNKASDFITEHSDKRNFIYLYCNQPDGDEHYFGVDAPEVRKTTTNIEKLIQKNASKLKNSLVFILADHGHVNTTDIDLDPYILSLLEDKTFYAESRFATFFVKEGCKKLFREEFNRRYSSCYKLLSREEFINSEYIGKYVENSYAKYSLGDFVALATKDISLFIEGQCEHMIGEHAGITDEEMYVPLIILDVK